MAKTSTTIFDAIRDIIKHKTDTRLITGTRTGPVSKPTIIPASGVKMDSKKNLQFRKDKKRLDAMSRKDIEALRAKLIAKREAKKKKTITPIF